MTNMVRKATNTVAVRVKSKNLITEFFENCTLDYFKKRYYEGFYTEHMTAVKSCVSLFVANTNHVILHAPTQSGKTSVMTLLYNVINESYIREILGVKNVIYLTGDNQYELSEQSMKDFRQHCHMTNYPLRLSGKKPLKENEFMSALIEWSTKSKIPFTMIKNSDCKKFKNIKGFSLEKTLIMIDESQYGTMDIRSQVNQLLQEFGKDFSGDPKKLVKHNTYILSVSATPYNEEYADKVNNGKELLKGIVYYQPGKGYIGFRDLHLKGMIKGLKDNSIVTNEEKFKDFLKTQREKMDKIYEETNQRHAIIVRMQGKKTLLSKLGENYIKKIAQKYGFKINVVDYRSGQKIDYDSAYDEIRYNQFEDGENIMVIVRQGFSYGIRIPNDVKPLISTIYDYRPSIGDTTTDSTEQGLLGRMTGYHPNGISKYLEIHIAIEHLDGLVAYHVQIPHAETPNPSKHKTERVECSFDEWDGKIEHIELWNNNDRRPLIVNGKIVDNFFEKHPEFPYDELFNTDKTPKVGTIAPIAEAFNKEVLGGRFETPLVEARRHTNKGTSSDNIANNLGYTTPILSNGSRKGWRTVENAKANKEGYGCVIDIRKAKGKNGIEIRIPWGHIGFSKEVKEYKQRPNLKGYQKVDIPEYVLAAQD